MKNTGMQTKTKSRVYNLIHNSRSRNQNNLLLFIIPFFLSVIIPSPVTGKDIDWSILSSDDTLVVFIMDTRVGMLYSKVKVDSVNKTIIVSQSITISADAVAAGNFGGMEMDETRVYDLNGFLISASQKLKSQSGVASWELAKKEKDIWQLTITAGGMANSRTIDKVSGNLNTSYTIQEGINKRNISTGQEWKDTLFELTSAKNMIITAKCTAVPDKKNINYVFISHNDLVNMDERHEVDASGRIVLQEVPPIFVAKRYGADDKKESGKDKKKAKVDYLYELFRIPIDRAQKNNETIALTVKPGAKIHKSVMRFYDYRDNKYLLKNLNKKCHTKNLSVKKSNLKNWLSSTVTIQAGNPEIKNLAMTLKGTRTCRCEISKIYSDYLFRNIEKKHVATFSNAYETFKAGYGDCGEHAVLLTALLRSVGIESNVVFGMVYSPDKKGFYYHAWVVAFIKDLVFFDPALGVAPATKGYIPLVLDDDGTKMVYLAGLIGKTEISYISKK